MTSAVHMAGMGLAISVVAPALVLATRRGVAWQRVPAPPLLVLPAFVALHAVVTVAGHAVTPFGPWLALHGALFAGAVWFWLPVLAGRNSPALRSVYLFLAGPALDLAAIYLIIAGDVAGGLAMIVAMLPIGLAAVAVTWRWITEEERRAW
ncbi:hypothetical protein SAXI111661_11825 [Saccharomonospora xinjiangensis]|uniref:hypothetical protein n=1 Tax=Saccharomonospora xinjiangensis TaxID=75294 RepID=UPI0010C40399|nr:hypothetical protein [Saccharomonospora xinjiangensis]QBQ60970.1 hypothetical protein EYD13_13085 [Saccharomonospora xinjiangensis]